MKFYIEFKKPIVNSIYCKEFQASDLQEAKKFFAEQNPNDKIIKIESRD